MPKYACIVYWEQRCEVIVETEKPMKFAKVAEEAARLAEIEIGKLNIKQSPKRPVQLNEIHMVQESVNCDPDSDVQHFDAT